MQTFDSEDMSLEDALSSLNYKYEVFKPKILVFGVGGGGVNAVNNMIDSDLNDVDFVVANTDYQSLESSRIEKKILLGKKSTNGMGAGADPFVGKAAAEEDIEEIEKVLNNVSMVFITAGMGGGTGTGAAPVIAKKAKEMNILVAAIVTKPFASEGTMKMQQAEKGIEELKKYVDTLIIVPNQNLFRLANQETRMQDSLKMVDNVLKSGVKGITDLITKPGFINLDFADVKTVMKKMGKAMMGTGKAKGQNKAVKAVEEAISNPLLDNVSIRGAKGIIINITGSPDITLFEHEEATKRIKEEVGNDYADIIIGNVFDENMEDTMRVSIFATGIDEEDNSEYEDEDTDEENEFNNQKTQDSSYESPIRTVYLRSKINSRNKDRNVVEEDEDDDFFDMGEAAKYDEFSQKTQNQEKQTNRNRQDDMNITNKHEKKGGLFSSLFSRQKEEKKNSSFKFDEDDDDIDINPYNAPAYFRKNRK